MCFRVSVCARLFLGTLGCLFVCVVFLHVRLFLGVFVSVSARLCCGCVFACVVECECASLCELVRVCCVCVCVSVRLCVCVSVSVCLCVCVSVCLCRCACLPACLLACLPGRPSGWLLSASCLPVFLPYCLSLLLLSCLLFIIIIFFFPRSVCACLLVSPSVCACLCSCVSVDVNRAGDSWHLARRQHRHLADVCDMERRHPFALIESVSLFFSLLVPKIV